MGAAQSGLNGAIGIGVVVAHLIPISTATPIASLGAGSKVGLLICNRPLQLLADVPAHRIAEDYVEGEYSGGIVPAAQREFRVREAEVPVILHHL